LNAVTGCYRPGCVPSRYYGPPEDQSLVNAGVTECSERIMTALSGLRFSSLVFSVGCLWETALTEGRSVLQRTDSISPRAVRSAGPKGLLKLAPRVSARVRTAWFHQVARAVAARLLMSGACRIRPPQCRCASPTVPPVRPGPVALGSDPGGVVQRFSGIWCASHVACHFQHVKIAAT